MSQELFDAVIVGGGPSGLAAAIEGKRYGLRYVVLEKGGITNSILHFPTQMIFFTTPELLEIGGMPLVSEREKPTRNEALKYYRRVVGALHLNVHQYEEVREARGREAREKDSQRFLVVTPAGEYEAKNVVLSIGYYDNPNLIGVPGEDLPHVSHYYTEPYAFYDRDVVVVGGKNSAAEAALDLFRGGARVTLVHRGSEMGSTVKYWVRPDIENRFKVREIAAFFNARVVEINAASVQILQAETIRSIPAQQVFLLTGYHSSTTLFQQLGVRFDPNTLRPEFDPQTFETNVPGVYLAGSVVGGRQNAEVFIENGRFHGELVVRAIADQVS